MINTSFDPKGSLLQVILDTEQLYEGDLVEYFKAFFFLSTGHQNPYHNFRHGTHVLFLCYEGGRFHQSELTPRRLRNLMIAAIFHDFDHRGVKGDDSLNIELAIAALRRFVLPMDLAHLGDIELLLRSTQHPYVLADHELPLEALILRDADMMQAYSMAWIQQVVFGLAAEWGMAPICVLKMQEDFLQGQQFKTSWGRSFASDSVIVSRVEEVKGLLNVLLGLPATSPEIQEAMELANK